MLEHQQAQLVNGLQELYKLCTSGKGWEGPLLNESSTGRPLTHDILESLGVLQHDSHNNFGTFDEDPMALHRRLANEGADVLPRRESIDSDQESSQASIHDPLLQRDAIANPFSAVQLPTPPLCSPTEFQISDTNSRRQWHPLSKSGQFRPQSLQCHPGYTNWDTGMNPLALQGQRWVDSPVSYETQNTFLPNGLPDFSNTDNNVPMPVWTEDDFSSFLNTTMT